MAEEKRYIVELSEEQLRLIANCVEDCHRFAGGQCELWNTTSMMDNFIDLKKGLEELKPYVTPHLHPNASYGWNGGDCPNEHQRKFMAKTYPIYREILHFLACENNLDNVYTSSTLTCEEGGEPIKIIVKEV